MGYRRTYIRTDEHNIPCILQDIVPLGPLPKKDSHIAQIANGSHYEISVEGDKADFPCCFINLGSVTAEEKKRHCCKVQTYAIWVNKYTTHFGSNVSIEYDIDYQ